MRIQTKLFFITGVVFLSVIIISSLSVWTMNEISQLKITIDNGSELIADTINIHGTMKDLMFDIFTPQTYRLLKDIIHTPRFDTTLREFYKSVEEFKNSFSIFIESPRVKSLLRDDMLKDEYDAAKRISKKAFRKIEALKESLDELERAGVLGGEGVYIHIQTDKDESLIKFFDEVRTTSYYFTNNFKSFLSHFVKSLKQESKVIQRQILTLFWVITACIGLFTIFLSLVFSSRISKRIKIVETTIKKISKGDFTAQLNIRTRDEFGLLSDNFSVFIKDLKSNVDSILNLMRDIGHSITDRLDFTRILKLIVESAVKDTKADGAAILMADEYDEALNVKAKAGIFPHLYPVQNSIDNNFESESIKIGETILREAVKTGKPVFIRDTTQDARFKQKAQEDSRFISSLMAIPLVVSKRILCVLSIVKVQRNTFLTDLDYTNLSTFADYAALTIDNYFKYTELLEKREAEYQALQSQIQPHFLYNVLNGLIGLNRLGDRKSLENAIFALKGMLRYTLEQAEWTTIAEEFLFLQKYCDLQKIRFQERLEIHIYYDSNTADCRIPKLLLQPLVENAIIHGIEPLDRQGELNITARFNRKNGESVLGILISDNGIGFNQKPIEKKEHIGLSNVRERLMIAYNKASFNIKSRIGKGTQAVIEISEEEVRA